MSSFQDRDGRESRLTGTASPTEFVRQALAQFEGPLMRYALRLTGDLERAQDVVQDTFLKLCRQAPDSLNGHLAQWLFTVCRNRAFDVQRKERRMTSAVALDEQTQAPQAAPEAAVIVRDSAGKVFRLLDRLPDNQQEVVRLKFQNELSYQEIADVTGLTVSNVGFLLHTALKRLRELLKNEQFSPAR